MILEAAYGAHSTVGTFAFWLGVAAALMTAFYSWRLLIMSFHGSPRASAKVMENVHESPLTMTIPLGVLALGAAFSGWYFSDRFVGHDHPHFWGNAIKVLDDVIEKAHHVPWWVPESPLLMGVIGISAAYIAYMFIPGLPGWFARTFSGIHQFLYNKWYFDELFDWAFVKPAQKLGYGFWKSGDGAVIDGVGPDGVAAVTRGGAGVASAKRLRVPLCVCHGRRRRAVRHVAVDVRLSGITEAMHHGWLANPLADDVPAARRGRLHPDPAWQAG
jgi:NADH-quinone oxidoreductase subunit L